MTVIEVKMPVFIDNNNYIAWLYIRGIQEYIAHARTILNLSYGRVQYVTLHHKTTKKSPDMDFLVKGRF